jgi:hypothetical protein
MLPTTLTYASKASTLSLNKIIFILVSTTHSYHMNKERNMDAIIGRYRVHMEDTGLVLRHMSGINFDMTPDEALGLLNFLSAYRENLTSFSERETDHNLKRIAAEKAEQEDEQP